MARRTRTRGAAVVVAALAVFLAAGGTTPVLAAGAADVPVYKTAGESVKGTASSGQAPTLKPGIYEDTIGVGETKYYGIDLDDVSTAYLSGFALPRPGAKVAYNDGISLELESSSGTGCDSSAYTFGSDGAARAIGGYAERKIDRDGYCQESGHYLFSITRDSDGTSDPGLWPVEIRYMLEPALKKGSVLQGLAPPPSATPSSPTGEARPVKGGTGFNDAAEVEPGVWKDRLVPGQVTYYRVLVDWGQQLLAVSEFANAEKITDDSGYVSDGAAVGVYNTARGPVTSDSSSYDGEQVAPSVVTYLADYTNRLGSTDEISAMRFAGWYYVAVALHPGVDEFVDGGVDVTLRLKLEGEPQKGPEYATDATEAGFGMSDEAFDGGAGTSGHGKKLLGYGAFAVGGLLVTGLLGWVVIARRNTPRDAVPAGVTGGPGPMPGGYGNPGYGDTAYGSSGYGDPRGSGTGGGGASGGPPPGAW